jgi:hypothetical protein
MKSQLKRMNDGQMGGGSGKLKFLSRSFDNPFEGQPAFFPIEAVP